MTNSTRRISLALVGALSLTALLLVGCKSNGDGTEQAEGASAGAAEPSGEEASSESGAARFDGALAEKPCELLTAAMVASAFEVSEDELEQSSFGDSCSYEWSGEDKKLQAELSSIEVHDDAEAAASAFETSTKSTSADEVAAGMEKAEEQMDESEDVGEEEKATAEKVGEEVGGLSFTYEDVSGVGDKARILTSDGTLHVLKDNLTFQLLAYYGPEMPVPEEVTGESMQKAAQEWMRETLPERREAGTKLVQSLLSAL